MFDALLIEMMIDAMPECRAHYKIPTARACHAVDIYLPPEAKLLLATMSKFIAYSTTPHAACLYLRVAAASTAAKFTRGLPERPLPIDD